jgi:predicted permease
VVREVSALRNGVINDTSRDVPEQLRLAQVSADFFALFGAPVAHGRTFRPEEDLPHGERVVVLGQDFWKRRFASDPGVLGQTLSLAGDPYTIVGILGDFPFREFGPTPEVFTAFQFDPNSTDQGHYFTAAGRLAPGVTIGQARTRIAASATAFLERFPGALGPGSGFSVDPIRDVLVRNVRSSLFVLVGAVAFVLLIACANVANLLLARATGRTREMAVRAAIGGSRGRIIRQLLTESMVLSTIGGLFGLAFGMVGMRALLAVNTAGLPRVGEGGVFVAFDWRVAAFTMAIALGTGFVFGLIPALQGSRADLTTSLKEASGRSGTGLRQNVSRSLLVVTEVALALVLLIGSALLIRTSIALANVDPGFDTTNVLTMQTSLAGPEFATAAGVALVVRNGVERLRAVPGVEDATSACCVPLQGGYGLPFVIQGRPLEGPFHGGGAWVTISPGYFEVFKIPIKRGRSLTERDDAGGAPVVLINEAMARQFWPDGDPLNDRLVIGRGVMREFAAEPERQIIGIVGDTRDGGLNADPQPRMFVPQAQIPDAASALNTRLTPLAWMVRTRSSSQAMTSSVTEALREATGIPVSNVRLMSDVVSLSTSRQRFNMWLMTVFGASALLLAAIGIYGLMAYSVAQRTQEIGIRLALGAQAATVRNMVIWQGMRLSFIGGAVGVGAAFFLARYIQQFLFEVQPWDPVAFVVVPITLLAVSFVAVSLPALRASHVDPLDALRGE